MLNSKERQITKSNHYSFVTGLALNTSSLTARRDSFDRNTSAFSPSLDYSSSSIAANGNGTANRKWPVNNYGALGTMASVSPLAPGTPPPTGMSLRIQCSIIILN